MLGFTSFSANLQFTAIDYVFLKNSKAICLQKFKYRDVALGAKHSNTLVLRALATTRGALELDLCR
jgi:hypothetical protein